VSKCWQAGIFNLVCLEKKSIYIQALYHLQAGGYNLLPSVFCEYATLVFWFPCCPLSCVHYVEWATLRCDVERFPLGDKRRGFYIQGQGLLACYGDWTVQVMARSTTVPEFFNTETTKDHVLL
jgi:hypothetical protein